MMKSYVNRIRTILNLDKKESTIQPIIKEVPADINLNTDIMTIKEIYEKNKEFIRNRSGKRINAFNTFKCMVYPFNQTHFKFMNTLTENGQLKRISNRSYIFTKKGSQLYLDEFFISYDEQKDNI